MEIEELSGGAVVGVRYYDNIAVRTATGLVWVITDRNNTSTIQIDADTLQAEQRRFLPYGEPPAPTQPSHTCQYGRARLDGWRWRTIFLQLTYTRVVS
jgi:hypothetical protein